MNARRIAVMDNAPPLRQDNGAMSYAAAVAETWRHYDLGNARSDHLALVRYATLAASSHNTQPWKFAVERRRITILPDLSRRCPEVDPDDHHLYVSLGCAAENLLCAAEAAGLRGHASFEASTSSLRLELEDAPAHRSPLFEAIPRRQCSRVEYDGAPLSAEERRLLEQAASGPGVSVVLLTDRHGKEKIAEYVAEGNRAQFADGRWSAELKEWMRFDAREAERRRDGLYGGVLGVPDVPPWLGKLAMGMVASARRQSAKDAKHIQSSAAILVVCSEANDREHWIEAGRCYERLALRAAASDLRTAFVNQPVEVPALRAQLASFLGIGNRRPDLVIRIGHGPEALRSLRRPLDDVLVPSGGP